MSELYAITAEPPPPASPPPRRGHPVLAWLVILGVVAFMLWRSLSANSIDKQKYDLLTARFQGRYLIGLEQLQKQGLAGDKDAVYRQARESLDQHTYAQRLRFVVLAGELKGPAEAREQLRRLNDRYRQQRGAPPDEEAHVAELLDRLYAARQRHPKAPPSLSQQDQENLRQKLGWFGDLALTPADSDSAEREAVLAPTYRTVYSLLGGGTVLLGLGMLGLVLLVTLVVLWFLNLLPGGLRTGSPHGGIYTETFAVYLLLFLGLSVAGRFVLQATGLKQGSLALSGVAALASLTALFWPVLRGVSWRQVRQDIGWIAGRHPLREALYGVVCYVTSLPMLAVALVIVVVLTKLRDRLGWGPGEFDPSNAPGHPIVFSVANAGWWIWLEVLFVASIVAPLVEETMFRGVLYRHVREATSPLPPVSSVLVSALLVSFVFAVIHPQGVLGVPALMALAIAFALMREWRGTLIPSMVAHGINNGVATLLLFLMTS